MTLVVGIPFGVVRARGGNVIGLAISHALLDAFAVLQLASLQPETPSTGESVGTIAVSAVIAAGYVIWYRITRPRQATDSSASGVTNASG